MIPQSPQSSLSAKVLRHFGAGAQKSSFSRELKTKLKKKTL
jgi:hypothetical protein